MSENTFNAVGWLDIASDEADSLQHFYCEVLGCKAEPVDMGGYNDYMLMDADGKAVAGVCHARGVNSDYPANVWLPYLRVSDLAAAIANAERLGGTLCTAIRRCEGYGEFCVLRDPAGALIALGRFD